jgi:hypothetical protein
LASWFIRTLVMTSASEHAAKHLNNSGLHFIYYNISEMG